MTSPLVSVIIPTYNRADVICATIDNVFEQTYHNIELIVVDDGSTDDTQNKLHRYGQRIRKITQGNSGPAAARNRGAQIARGDVIAFQDSDDLWEPSKLERQIALLERSGSSVPCCLVNVRICRDSSNETTSFDTSLIQMPYEEGIWINVSEVLATRFVLFNQAVAIRREVYEKVGGFDESLKDSEDYDLSLRLSLEGPWAFIREPLTIYHDRCAQERLSRQALKDGVTLKERELKIVRRLIASVDPGQSTRLRRLLKRRMRVFQQGLRRAKLSESKFWGARTAAHLMGSLSHYQDAAFRRSPWFPKAVAVPIGTTKRRINYAKTAPSVRW